MESNRTSALLAAAGDSPDARQLGERMEQQGLAAGRLARDAARHFTAHWKLVLLTLLGLGVAAMIHVVIGFAVLSYAQYELTYAILAERDVLSGGYGRRRYIPVFGLQLLLWVIFAVGWTMLILPGVYLMLRLYFAVPALIAEETGVFEAMAASWRRTARQELALFGATALAALPVVLLWVAIVVVVQLDAGVAAIAMPTILALIVTALFPVFCSSIAATGYCGAGGETHHLQQVFS